MSVFGDKPEDLVRKVTPNGAFVVIDTDQGNVRFRKYDTHPSDGSLKDGTEIHAEGIIVSKDTMEELIKAYQKKYAPVTEWEKISFEEVRVGDKLRLVDRATKNPVAFGTVTVIVSNNTNNTNGPTNIHCSTSNLSLNPIGAFTKVTEAYFQIEREVS